MVVYLASQACQITHRGYSAAAGRYARAFAGLADGWLAEPGSGAAAKDIADHFPEIAATEPFTGAGVDLRRGLRTRLPTRARVGMAPTRAAHNGR